MCTGWTGRKQTLIVNYLWEHVAGNSRPPLVAGRSLWLSGRRKMESPSCSFSEINYANIDDLGPGAWMRLQHQLPPSVDPSGILSRDSSMECPKLDLQAL